MKPIIQDIREISDSREMYESKPHKFLSFFIYLLLIAIVVAGIWMCYGEIDIVSKGTGIVRPNEMISTISNKVDGVVSTNNLEEGKIVSKGDILFTITYDDLEISRKNIVGILEQNVEEIKNLGTLKESILSGKNLFSKEENPDYYEKYIKYQTDCSGLRNKSEIRKEQVKLNDKQIETSKQIYDKQIDDYTKEIAELQTYNKSVNEGISYFLDKSSSYSLELNNYLLKMQVFEVKHQTLKEEYEYKSLLAEEGFEAEKKVEEAKLALESVENEIQNYTNTIKQSIKQKIEETEKARQAVMFEQEKLVKSSELDNLNSEQEAIELEKYKRDTIVNLTDQIDTLEKSNKTNKRELESIEVAIDKCAVKAPIDGTIHITTDINAGDLLVAGAQIGSIIPANDGLYNVEIFMPNSEIANIKEGDVVNYRFDALPYEEYGQLEGEIKKISSDAKVNEMSQMIGYEVEGAIENKPLYSYKNVEASIKVGMTCEAHVIRGRKKIIYYLLEKINLIQ